MNATIEQIRSTKGAASYQPGATPQEHRTPLRQGLKARPNTAKIGSGLQPSMFFDPVTQGVALGWYEAGASPLRKALL